MRAHKARTETYALDIDVFWGEHNLIYSEHLYPARPYCVPSAMTGPTAPHVETAALADDEAEPPLITLDGDVVVVHGQSEERRLRIGEEASVSRGALQFRVRVVQPTRPLIAAPLDLKRHMWTGASLSVHAFALLCMTLMPPKASSLSLDLMSQDDRYVRYLATPIESMDELPWTPDVGHQGKSESREDAQAHRGEQSKAGKTEAQRSDGRMAIRGDAQLRVPAKSAAEQARTAGILGVLSAADSAGPSSPFGAAIALGYDPQTAIGALYGTRIGENSGFHGLSLHGTGRPGGGGVGDTIGVGQLNTGDAARGTPGSRSVTHPGRESRVPRALRMGPVETLGSLSKEVIRRVIQRHLNEVRFCYEEGLREQPELGGRVAIRFMISPAGVVQQAQVANSELNHSATDTCIAGAVRRWTFPEPEGGGYVTVSYPFVFDRPQ